MLVRAALLPSAEGVRRRALASSGTAARSCTSSRRRSSGSSSGSGSSTSLATLSREARALGYVRNGRAPLHRQGHPPVAGARAGQHDGPAWTLTPTRPRRRARQGRRRPPDRPRAARVPPRRRALPVRTPGGHRAEPVRPDRRAVPDDVLRDVPPPRRRDLAARGGRRRRALDAPPRARIRSSPPASPPRTTNRARIRRELAGDETGRDGGASLDLGVGGAGTRLGLAEVPPRPRRLRARPARLRARPRGSSPSSSRSGRTRCCWSRRIR